MRFSWFALYLSLMACASSIADDAPTPSLEVEIQSTAVALSPDARFMAVANGGHSVKLLSLLEGKPVAQLGELPAVVKALSFSPDGKLLAAAGVSETRPVSFELRMWRLEDKKIVYEVSEPDHRDGGDTVNPIACLRFSPDSQLLARPGRKRTVEIYDIQQQRMAHSFRSGLVVSAVQFDPGGKSVVIGTDTGPAHGSIRHIDLATGKLLPSHSLVYSGVLDIVFSPDGATLYAGHRGRLGQWDTKTGMSSTALKSEDRFLATALAFSPQAHRAALLNGKELQIWDIGHGTMSSHWPMADGCLAWSADGSILVTATTDQKLRAWRINANVAP